MVHASTAQLGSKAATGEHGLIGVLGVMYHAHARFWCCDSKCGHILQCTEWLTGHLLILRRCQRRPVNQSWNDTGTMLHRGTEK